MSNWGKLFSVSASVIYLHTAPVHACTYFKLTATDGTILVNRSIAPALVMGLQNRPCIINRPDQFIKSDKQ